MRFCRKSPAVGSIKRHWPAESWMETEENARTAVLSRGLDSAAAEGWRTPPARETGTGVVGFAVTTSSDAEAVAVPCAWDTLLALGDADVEEDEGARAISEAAAALVEIEPVLRGIVMVIIVVDVHPVELAIAWAAGVEIVAAASVVEAAAEAVLLPPKVNDCAELDAQVASSRTLPDVTARQVPTAFKGSKEKVVELAREKS